MDEKSYNKPGNHYRHREEFSSLYSYGRNNITYRHDRDETPLPFGMGFRLRLLLCIILFLFFLLSDHFVFQEKEMQTFYQKLEETTSGKEWKNYAVTVFENIKELDQ